MLKLSTVRSCHAFLAALYALGLHRSFYTIAKKLKAAGIKQASDHPKVPGAISHLTMICSFGDLFFHILSVFAPESAVAANFFYHFVAPVSFLTFTTFWAMKLYDDNLLLSADQRPFYPSYHQHNLHTTQLFTILLPMLNTNFTKFGHFEFYGILIPVFALYFSFILWSMKIFKITGMWNYGIMELIHSFSGIKFCLIVSMLAGLSAVIGSGAAFAVQNVNVLMFGKES